ncbi:MAG: sulfite exporter TauE/SafE family protein [Candidatus Kerfeldbacteria bacterium]|nr:sulfite exporter TauE/SafE family protein [Candidatus Kerfeldbacteria bacterium]
MPEIVTLFLVLLAGIAAGFFDSVIGAGGLVSIPSLVFLGLPPQVAIATDRLGSIGQTATAAFKFWKAKKIVWKYVPAFTIISLVGSVIGASILLNVNPAMLQSIVGYLLLALLPFIFLRRDIGIKGGKTSRPKMMLGLVIYFLIMIFAGFFGQGTGPMVFYALTYFLGFTMLEVLATGIVPWFVLSVSSLIIFALNGIVDYQVGIVLLIGMAVGGYAGAHVAIKKGDVWIKRLFALFVVVSAVKLLFF